MTPHKKPKTINTDNVDPSVYYYDEVYDDMQREQDEDERIGRKSKQNEGSKYIQGISEAAERRKSEKEIRKFRRYTKDREEAQANSSLHDEDIYISKSYEKKLKEVNEAIKKQSVPDTERAFNVFKKAKCDDGDTKPIGEQPIDKTQQIVGAKRSQHCDTQKSDVEQHSATQDRAQTSLPNETAQLQRPTTIEERREYLRRVLAKRTTGDSLKAAQERYRQRKANS